MARTKVLAKKTEYGAKCPRQFTEQELQAIQQQHIQERREERRLQGLQNSMRLLKF